MVDKNDMQYEDLSAGQAAWQRRFDKALLRLDSLESVAARLEAAGDQLEWLKIDFRGGGVGEFMVIAKVLGSDGGPLVAFEGASSPVLALDKMLRKLRSGECRWKEDKYHGTNGKA